MVFRSDEALAACDRLAAIPGVDPTLAPDCRCAHHNDAVHLTEAAEACRAAVAANEAAHGPAHPLTAGAMTNAAVAASRQGRLDEATARVQRSLAIREQQPRPTRGLANCHALLGEILAARGDADGASRHAGESLRIAEAVLGADHPDLVMLLSSHGDTHLALKRWPSALASFDRCDEAALAADQALAIFTAGGADAALLAEARATLERARTGAPSP
jgi:tetratricopeptide (TPR) repeat protein